MTMATAITTLTVWTNPGLWLTGDPLAPVATALIMVFYIAIVVAVLSFLPFCLIVLIAEFRSTRTPIYYAIMGGLTGVAVASLPLWMPYIPLGKQVAERHEMHFSFQLAPFTRLTVALFTVGLAGGLAYWAVAGHSAGRREPTSPGPSGS